MTARRDRASSALAAVTTLATTSVVVEPGDTLTQLAADHDVTVAELIDWNDLDDPDLILAGTTLVFSSPSAHGDPAAGVSGGGDHTVVAGDTLWLIARRYGASVSALAQANGLSDPDRIHVGQRLVVTDASSSEAVDSPEPSGSRTGPTDDVGSGS
ncbi:MAG: LysM peptidoglycan-binding domain-containing protein, partial [Actinomycetia bacterium]|nr:LysM peptidoglycan-binding domain-containing protein [Actinomycetes bacterium]